MSSKEIKNVTINFKKYFNSYIMQPYFIWEKKESDNVTYKIPQYDINGLKLYDDESLFKDEKSNFEFDFFNASLDDEEDEEDDDSARAEKIWNRIFEQAEDKNWDYSQRSDKLIFDKVNEQLTNFLIYKIWNLTNQENIYFLNTLQKVDMLKEEMEKILQDDKINYIINPVFIYNYKTVELSTELINFYLKASPFAYDKKNHTIYLAKFKDWNNVTDYLQANWIYQLAKYNNLPVKSIQMILFDANANNIKQGEIQFTISEAANPGLSKKSKSSAFSSKVKTPQTYKEEKWNWMKLINNGQIYQNSKFILPKYTFMQAIYEEKPLGKIKFKTVNKNDLDPKVEFSSKFELYSEEGEFGNFDQHINKIIEGYFEDLPTYFNKNHELILEEDFHQFYGRNNKLKNQILFKILGSKNQFSPGILKLSSKLPFNQQYVDDFSAYVNNLKKIPNHFSLGALYEVSKYLKQDKRYIWYDYEGVSAITPILDGFAPYRQITNQVSIIETINGEIIYKKGEYCKNIVKDPLGITLLDIVDNIIEVYSNKADFYIVYNKTYENTRNKEIAEAVENAFFYQKHEIIEGLKKYNIFTASDFWEIVNHINSNTLDLKDFLESSQIFDHFCFEITNNFIHYQNRHSNEIEHSLSLDPAKYAQNAFASRTYAFGEKKVNKNFFIYELLGKKSIKNIEKLITKNNLKLRYSEFFKEYKDLEIKNGTLAMQAAINRYNGVILDNEWAKITENLKEYCQNDVVAMLVTFSFFVFLINNVFKDFETLMYKLKDDEIIEFDKNTYKLKIKTNSI